MKPQVLGIFLFLFSISLSANSYNKGCDNYHCSKYEWDHGLKKFDPYSIHWPLHHTGEIHKDVSDGGEYKIHVAYFDHYGKKKYAPLKEFRKMPYCPDPYFLKEGIPMEYYFECEEHYATQPKWKSTDCSLLGKSYEDKVFYFDGPSCAKIVREWVLVDWCSYEPNKGADKNEDDYVLVYDMTSYKAYFAYNHHYGVKHDGYYKYTQVIKILDTEKPEIEDCEPITYDLKGKCSSYVKVKNTISDTGPCHGDEMQVSLEVYDAYDQLVHTDWFKARHGVEFWASAGHLYPGWYTLKWEYKDGCNNKNYCSQKLKVIDTAQPSLLCIQYLSTSISDEYGMTIWAKDFVLKATDPCGYSDDITFSFSADEHIPSLTFDCNGDFGFHDLQVVATAKNGTQIACNVELFIADHFACSDDMQIGGLVTNRYGDPLSSVDVDIMQSNDLVASGTSNVLGQYLVDGIPMDKSTELIEPHVYENPKKGLDVQDLIALLAHITGEQKFKDVLEYAAADVNSDSKIDMDDFWTLASLIYDLRHRKIDVKPWKFIDSKLYNAGIVRASALTVPIRIRTFRHRYDLIGLKTGDIDFSWSASPKAKNRSSVDMDLMKGERSFSVVNKGDRSLQALEIRIINAPQPLSFKLNELWDRAEVIETYEDGELRLVVASPQPLSVKDGTPILTVDGVEEFDADQIKVIVYENEGELFNTKEVSLQMNRIYDRSIGSQLVVAPNPFQNTFVTSFEKKTEGPVAIKLYSITGQLVVEKVFAGGGKEFLMDMNGESPGLYILEASGQFGTISKKVFKQ